MAKFCTRCGKQVGLLEGVVSYGERRRCKNCSTDIKRVLTDWRTQFRQVCADGLLTRDEWRELQTTLATNDIEQEEAVDFVRPDTIAFLQRAFTFAKSDGQIEEDEERSIRWLIDEFRLGTTTTILYLTTELDYLVKLREIRKGNIPTIKPSIVLPADEFCYLETPAMYQKVTKSGATNLPGRLIVTNKKIVFVAPAGGGEIPINKVLNVNAYPNGIFLELSRQANSGFYGVQNAQVIAETILAVARLATRQIIATGRDTRRIPQHIKVAVWQRDQGRCVQCNATEYLEFDHIIPHSKGGATSVENLQVLCRKCNLAKSDTI